MARIEAESPRVRGYWLDGAGRDDKTWCSACGARALRLLVALRREAGDDDVSLTACWSGDESVQRCRGCGVVLDTGGLFGAGIDEVLQSEAPDLPELLMVAVYMLPDDPRWSRWEQIADSLRGRS